MTEKKANSHKTLIVGATANPSRYAYLAAKMLAARGFDFIPIGIKMGEVFGKKIVNLRSKLKLEDIHTITLYLGADNQSEWIDYLIGLSPNRIIFNPGTENSDFCEKASEAGIEVLQACNLVMLRTDQF